MVSVNHSQPDGELAPTRAPSLRIAIVEAMQTTAQMLQYFCHQLWCFDVVAMAHTGANALEQLSLIKPEVILLDLFLPDMDGITFISAMIGLLPTARIIVMAPVCNDYQLHKLGNAAICGFVDRFTDGLGNLRQAITQVSLGETYFSLRYLQASRRLRGSDTAFFKLLSEREQEVLLWIVQSLSDDEIAAQLDVSVATAKTHRRKIMQKLDLPNTPKLIRYGFELGIGMIDFPNGTQRVRTFQPRLQENY